MKSLKSILEGILDADYDINDGAILDDVIRKAMDARSDATLPQVTAEGEWLVFDCSNTTGNDIMFVTFEPIRNAGYSKYRFINCRTIELYTRYKRDKNAWNGVEIDAPNSRLEFTDNNELIIERFSANVRYVGIDANDSDNMKISMKNCKFNTKCIKVQAVTQLSIADTCKFEGCRLLYLGRVGKSVVRKANQLLLGDLSNGESFKRKAYDFTPTDEMTYWDIDVMKTLSLKANKWPDLGKIVIVPNGIPAASAPAICLYHMGKTMLPISKRMNKFIAEYENGWKGSIVSRGYTELNTYG